MSMLDLLNAGLQDHLLRAVIETTDSVSFLAAAEVLLTRQAIARNVAEARWGMAAHHYFDTHTGVVRSRVEFMRFQQARLINIAGPWVGMLGRLGQLNDPLRGLHLFHLHERDLRFTWLFQGEGAELPALLFIARLQASSEEARTHRLGLRLRLLDAIMRLDPLPPEAAAVKPRLVEGMRTLVSSERSTYIDQVMRRVGRLALDPSPHARAPTPSFDEMIEASRQWTSEADANAWYSPKVGTLDTNQWHVRFGDYA